MAEVTRSIDNINYVDNDLRTYIGSVPLQWSVLSSDSKGGTLKKHRLEDKDNTLITSNTELENRKISFKCKMNHEVKNRDELFKELEMYRDTKQIIDVFGVVQYRNMQILNISKPIDNIEVFEFDIDLEEIEFTRIKTTGEVSETDRTQLQKQQQTGIQGVSKSNKTVEEVKIT